MSQWLVGFIVGILVGAVMGLLVMSLCVAASNSNRGDERRR